MNTRAKLIMDHIEEYDEGRITRADLSRMVETLVKDEYNTGVSDGLQSADADEEVLFETEIDLEAPPYQDRDEYDDPDLDEEDPL